MVNMKTQIYTLKCQRCGHKWIPRQVLTNRVCPKCHSYLWDKPRISKSKEEEKKADLKTKVSPDQEDLSAFLGEGPGIYFLGGYRLGI